MNLQSVAPSTLSEIGQAAGAYPALKQQYDINQQQLEAQKFQNASARLAQMQDLFGRAPQLAGTPQAQQVVTALYKQMGVPAPLDPKTGQIDLAAMGTHAPWQTLLSDQANYTYAMALDPAARSNFFQAHGIDPSTVPQNILSAAPSQVTTPTEAGNLFSKALTEISDLGKGIGNIDNIQAEIKTFSPSIDRIFGQGASVQLANSLSANIGPYVQARITQAAALGQLDKAKIPEIQAEINHLNSMNDLNAQKTEAQRLLNKYLPALTQSRIDANEARVTSANASVARANAYVSKIASDLKLVNTLGPGSKSWTATINSIDSQMKGLGSELGNLIKQRDALGNVANLSGPDLDNYNSLQTQIQDKQAQQTQLQTAAANMYTKTGLSGGVFSHGIPINHGVNNGRTVTLYSDGTALYDDNGQVAPK